MEQWPIFDLRRLIPCKINKKVVNDNKIINNKNNSNPIINTTRSYFYLRYEVSNKGPYYRNNLKVFYELLPYLLKSIEMHLY